MALLSMGTDVVSRVYVWVWSQYSRRCHGMVQRGSADT